MIKARMIVEGNVQGVGYRALVKQVARRMGIKGWVRNLEDGTVEIYCQADKTAIEAFRERIYRKTRNSEDVFSLNVEKIQLCSEGEEGYIAPKAKFEAFKIDYGKEARSEVEKCNLERLEIGSLILSDFRADSNVNFHALDEKYHTVSGELNSINQNIAKLTESISRSNELLVKLIGSCIENKRG